MAYLLFIVFITLVIALIVALAKDSQSIDKKKARGYRAKPHSRSDFWRYLHHLAG